MKLWLIEREPADWDEYDAFVIRAETSEDALAVARQAEPHWDGNDWRPGTSIETTIVEVSADGDEEIILGSFNAG